jgi:membrane protease YdiL (CAAX protease family)
MHASLCLTGGRTTLYMQKKIPMGYEMAFLARLLFFLLASALLINGKGKRLFPRFVNQSWTTRDVLPLYVLFAFAPLLVFVLHNAIASVSLYYICWVAVSFAMATILLVWIYKVLLRKQDETIKAIGINSGDFLLLMLFNIVIYFALISILLLTKKATPGASVFGLVLTSLFMTVTFWPILEDVFYLGILYIPTSRIIGLGYGAVFVSVSCAVSHYHYGLENLMMKGVMMAFSCYIFVKSERLVFPIGLHSLTNSIVFWRDLNQIQS